MLPLSNLPAVKDSKPITDHIWVPTSTIPLDPSFNDPQIRKFPDVGKAPPPEWVVGMNAYFVTLFRVANGAVWVGYLGGRVEVWDYENLEVCYGALQEMYTAPGIEDFIK